MVPADECEKLRMLVQDCIEKHVYPSASFFANKLVTLSGSEPGDVYLLAQTLYVSRQYRRVLHLLQRTKLVEMDGRFRYLGAKCLAECQLWDECLDMLGDGEGEDPKSLQEQGLESLELVGCKINMYSAFCLLRGKVYLALENRTKAVHWLKASVTSDPFCHEAFSLLVEGHLLTAEQEQQLLSSITFPENARWLELVYRCQCKSYGQETFMEGYLAELEPSSSSTPQQGPRQQQEQQQPGPSPPAAAATGIPSSSPSFDLTGNSDVVSCRADWLYHQGRYQECHTLTTGLLGSDPYDTGCLPTHLAAALQLGRKNELFIRGHKLVEEYPDSAVSWFAVGCYHTCVRQHSTARRYFGKCTSLDQSFAPAWVAFGGAFAELDESDQAVSAYRTAVRLFPGLHHPLLGIAMEYQRMNNLSLAKEMFLQVQAICPTDALVCNELGVLLYREGQHREAEEYLRRALDLVPKPTAPVWEPTLVNLGHVLRKQLRFREALDCYGAALGIAPSSPGTYVAIGYTNHLAGNLEEAIENYHKALGLRPEDSFAADMLAVAVEEECNAYSQELVRGGSASGAGHVGSSSAGKVLLVS